MCMRLFSADKDFFVTGVCMVMPVTLFLAADKSFYFPVTGIIMHMLGKLTNQISISIKTSIVDRMLMFRGLTD